MTKPRPIGLCIALLAVLVVALAPGAARAYWHGGYGWGGGWGGGWRGGGCCWGGGGVFLGIAPPIYVGPPVYYAPPPVLYAPPPAYSAPPANAGPPPAANACYAAQWVCPLERPAASGDSCSCPAPGGRAWGRAN